MMVLSIHLVNETNNMVKHTLDTCLQTHLVKREQALET
jgi:hypothetical protein